MTSITTALAARRERRILASLPPVTLATADDPQRSPDWCHSHNCHKSACPTPEH